MIFVPFIFVVLGVVAIFLARRSKALELFDRWMFFVSPAIFGIGLLVVACTWHSLLALVFSFVLSVVYVSALGVRYKLNRMIVLDIGTEADRMELDNRWPEHLSYALVMGLLLLSGLCIAGLFQMKVP